MLPASLAQLSRLPFPLCPQFANKYGAQRALLRSGEQLSSQVMVGVKPLDAQHRAAVERAAAGGGGGAAGSAAGPSLAMAVPKPAAAAAARSYAVGGAAAAAAVVPLPSKGLVAKLQEFVLGL